MKHFVFVVHDSCSGVYDRPFIARSEADAVRSFGDIAMDANHMIGKHPEHFRLFCLGTYDDNSGVIDPSPPIHVVNAIDLVAQRQKVDPLQIQAFDDSISGNGAEKPHAS